MPDPTPSPAPATPAPDEDAAWLRGVSDLRWMRADPEGQSRLRAIADRLDGLTRDLAIARAEREEYRREWESACERDRAANALRVEAEAALAQAQKERDAAKAEAQAARGRWEHRDGPCDYCGTETNSLAASPSKWNMAFPRRDGTGVCRPHHTGCVLDRLARCEQAEAVAAGLRKALEAIVKHETYVAGSLASQSTILAIANAVLKATPAPAPRAPALEQP